MAESEKKQKRDLRVTLLFPKQVYKDFQILAHARGTTPNDIVNDFVKNTITESADIIAEQKALMERANSNTK